VTTGTVRRLPTSAFLNTTAPKYLDQGKLLPLFDVIAFHANTILVGPKGVAKTLSIATWAAQNKHPLVTFDCSEDIRRSHLIGSFILQGDETPFVLGPLTTAIEIANEVGSCVLCLEEINALTPQMQKVLNPLGDYRKRIEVPECERVFELKSGAKLWLCGTMNTSVYGGVYALNEDLKSRFRMLPIGYPEMKAELAILQALYPSAALDLLKQVLTLAQESRQGSLDYALSTRDVVQLVDDIQRVGLATALRLTSGKFEGTDQEFYATRSLAVFGKAAQQ
jgi:nitric oxide reductase NorQ protein